MPVVWDSTDSETSSPEQSDINIKHSKQSKEEPFLSTTPLMDEDEDDIVRSWQIFTKMKNVVHNGNRYENASWRRWFQKRNGIKISSFAEADEFKPYADDSVFKVLNRFDKTNSLKEILDKSLEVDTEPETPPLPVSSSLDNSPISKDQEKKKRKARKRSVLKGLGLETNGYEEEEEEEDSEESSNNCEDEDDSCLDDSLTLSPASKRKCSLKKKVKKTVRFDESLNQTTFVRYTPDTWITGFSENVDEYCKLERRKRGLLLFEEEDIDTDSNSNVFSEEHAQQVKEKELKEESIRKAANDSHESFLLYLDTALTLVFEIGSFVQWCRSTLFR